MAELTRQVLGQWRRDQEAVCERLQVEWMESPLKLKVGVARNVRSGLTPLNGLRHPPQGDTTGWFLWAGEARSQEPGFFVPVHVEHLAEWCPAALPFLGLPSGWRFLVAPGYEDVWFDESLLEV